MPDPSAETKLLVTWTHPLPTCSVPVSFIVEIELTNRDQCEAIASPVPMTFSTTTDVSVDITGLQPFSTYTVYVTTTAGSVRGLNVSDSATTIEATPDGAPSNVQLVSSTDTSLVISWDEPPCNERNGVIQYYPYEFYEFRQRVTHGSSTTKTLTRDHLQCNRVYLFRIAAGTNIGKGPYSSQMMFATNFSPDPFIPNTDVTVTPVSKNQVIVSWEPSKCPASDFTVEHTLQNEDQCNEPQSLRTVVGVEVLNDESAIINDLAPFSSYTIFVSARSAEGAVVERSINIQTKEDVPSKTPANVRATSASSTTITYSWDEIPCGNRNGVITGYRYEVTQSDSVVLADDTPLRSITVESLLPNTEYSFRVAARTKVGLGDFSPDLTETTTVGGIDGSLQTPPPNCQQRPCSFGYHVGADGECQVARVIYFQLTITEIDGRPATFNFKLTDTTSQEYLQLTCRVISLLKPILNLPIEIHGVSGGSIVFDVAVVLDKDSLITVADVTSIVNAAVDADGYLPDTLRVESVAYIRDASTVLKEIDVKMESKVPPGLNQTLMKLEM
ncbi:netrin receptor unc-40-like isoform X2 [Amphiura filiformis]|uniref:netrin receptor unc-40-like isoform X2 n=1 Tax=Amphiura filiformis TaxID=82378 RepID=UPI003B2268F1